MQMETWFVSKFSCSHYFFMLTYYCYWFRIWNDRSLICIVLAMQMARWCLLMLPVHKEFQVKGNIVIWLQMLKWCFQFTDWKDYWTVVEQVTGRDHVLNHLSIPAACFTHPEISMVGLTEVWYNYLLFIMLVNVSFIIHLPLVSIFLTCWLTLCASILLLRPLYQNYY
jgi:hypothetical protein